MPKLSFLHKAKRTSKLSMLSGFFVLASLLSLALPFSVFAQSTDIQSIEVTYTYDVNDSNAKAGDILVNTSDGLKRASIDYDNRLFGVYITEPLMVFKEEGDSSKKAIARNGIAQVNVTNLNGEIKAGDFITSSTIPGAGAKAQISGYVIGSALASFGNNDGTAQNIQINNTNKSLRVGTIPVALRIEYGEVTTPRSANHFLDQLNVALFTNLQNPEKSVQFVRYILASLIALVAFAIGFFTFARSVPKSIEAIGRNPLAKNAIYFSIVLSIIFTVLTALVGLGAAFVIIRF